MDTLFSTPQMSEIFSPAARVKGMLAFEAGLARAQARRGIIPGPAAEAIADRCRVELFDVASVMGQAEQAGTPALPLVARLTELVDGEAKRYVHWGATSQDAMDTALMLQAREGLAAILDGLDSVSEQCARLAQKFAHTLMPGRTLLQHAVPVTFGLKAARWLSMVRRRSESLGEAAAGLIALQLGGAAGTLAAATVAAAATAGRTRTAGQDPGPALVEELAAELGLPAADLPWHAERDRVADIASRLGVVAGAMSKIASDITLLSQTEVAEAVEAGGPGKGGSSAMPQKHNPVDSVRALAAVRLAVGTVPVILSAMAPAHERGAGDWQVEAEAVASLFCHTACAVEAVDRCLRGLSVDAERMAENLDRTNGRIMAESLTMALAPELGRPAAQKLVEDLCRKSESTGASLGEVARGDPRVMDRLPPTQLERTLDPGSWLGSTDALIQKSLEGFHSRQAVRRPS